MKTIKLFEIQKKLDLAIHKKHNIIEEKIIEKKIIALYVEISEFINEVASFKYWKNNKNISKEKILEEYADCLHFFMTFYVYKNIKKNVKPIKGKNINKMILNLYKNISNFQDNLNEINLDKSFSIFLGIGNILKFDWNEVEKYYLMKNKINFDRLKNNY